MRGASLGYFIHSMQMFCLTTNLDLPSKTLLFDSLSASNTEYPELALQTKLYDASLEQSLCTGPEVHPLPTERLNRIC